jgi:hypothetical protein
MNKIEIKNRFTGEVIYSHECEDNTIRKTVEQAVKDHAYLRNADLSNADLSNADLSNADLSNADLRNAYLSNADLRNAYLSNADLSNAHLSNADLSNADLSNADLSNADLSNADLRNAYLSNADLSNADLSNADLSNADLRNADLRNAYLSNAYLRNAYLRNAHLDEDTKISFVPFACPSDGAFVGWKKVNGKLVKLLIPEDARRSSATSNKCRCDKAQVLAITDTDGNNPIDQITNYEYTPCDYIVGETVTPDSFDEDRWNECSHGIHFFINKQEAINY